MSGISSSRPYAYGLQLLGTLAILAFVPGNYVKAGLMLVLWLATFGRSSRAEAVLFLIACGFFTVMNALSLRQGIFAFSKPDVLGMPFYELFMWGFYLLHTRRVIDGPAPPGPARPAWALAILFSAAFGLIADQVILLWVTAILLAIGLLYFHERQDLAYVGYMVLLGAAIEYTGVHAGEWFYPNDPVGGVPPWFITLWGGVGLFLRRLVLPVLARFEAGNTPRRS